jgi:hypothetical protein
VFIILPRESCHVALPLASHSLSAFEYIPGPKQGRARGSGPQPRTQSPNPAHVSTNPNQSSPSTIPAILLPRLEFDIKSTEKAVYVGTLRLHRDEFNEVTKAEILDHYAGASAEFKKKFGNRTVLRKAMAKPLK